MNNLLDIHQCILFSCKIRDNVHKLFPVNKTCRKVKEFRHFVIKVAFIVNRQNNRFLFLFNNLTKHCIRADNLANIKVKTIVRRKIIIM